MRLGLCRGPSAIPRILGSRLQGVWGKANVETVEEGLRLGCEGLRLGCEGQIHGLVENVVRCE